MPGKQHTIPAALRVGFQEREPNAAMHIKDSRTSLTLGTQLCIPTLHQVKPFLRGFSQIFLKAAQSRGPFPTAATREAVPAGRTGWLVTEQRRPLKAAGTRDTEAATGAV